jgi:hypothetical protein
MQLQLLKVVRLSGESLKSMVYIILSEGRLLRLFRRAISVANSLAPDYVSILNTVCQENKDRKFLEKKVLNEEQ